MNTGATLGVVDSPTEKGCVCIRDVRSVKRIKATVTVPPASASVGTSAIKPSSLEVSVNKEDSLLIVDMMILMIADLMIMIIVAIEEMISIIVV